MAEIIRLQEHGCLSQEQKDILRSHRIFENSDAPVSRLRLSPTRADYFIGADWLLENGCALVVQPKVSQLNYLDMFIQCLSHPATAREISKPRKGGERVYDIFFDEPSIPLKGERFSITPLIIIHFLKVVESIVRKGLMKGYVVEEKPLRAKVKGKVLVSRSIKGQLRSADCSQTFCRYETYTVDCEENRVLKKALSFVGSYLSRQKGSYFHRPSSNILNYCLSAFEQVTDDIDQNTIKAAKVNRFYREYQDGLKLAKMILKRFSFSLHNTQVDETDVPPFYINMPLLFELFVMTKLHDEFGKSLLYQSKGKGVEVDFLEVKRRLIIDTKYKTWYKHDDEYHINDIRQLSGYSRDEEVLTSLGVSEVDMLRTVPECVIIYPDQEAAPDFNGRSLTDKKLKMKGFINFFCTGISLP